MTSGSHTRTPARLILPALRSEALSGFAHEAGRIADALEITLATVKWRIYKAREEVQLSLAREGITFGPEEAEVVTAP
jgi:hypothetical protein